MRTPPRREHRKQLLYTERYFVVGNGRLDVKDQKPKFHFAMVRFRVESRSRRLKQKSRILTVTWIVGGHTRIVPGINDAVFRMQELGRDMP
jgi:hypothetical protein